MAHQGEDVVLGVLTSAQLFRAIAQWTIRWPERLATRWREYQRELGVRGHVMPTKARVVELFVRKLLVAGDAETLRLAGRSTWTDWDGRRLAFPFKELQFAVRAGHAEALRVAFQFTTIKQTWLWREAVAHFPGHCDVLEVLKIFTDPPRRELEMYRDTCRIKPIVEWMTRHLRALEGDATRVDGTPTKDTSELPTKRARTIPPSSSTPVPSRTEGWTALLVLTNRSIYQHITQWFHCWPLKLFTRWRMVAARIQAAEARNSGIGHDTPKELIFELLVRELMLSSDLEMLQLAVEYSQRDHCVVKRRAFPLEDLHFAIRSRDHETVQFVFEHYTRTSGEASFSLAKIVWFWREAMTHFPGHCLVLDVLRKFVPPPVDILVVTDLEDSVRDVETAQWFVQNVGPESLPPSAIVRAAQRGDHAMLGYLSSVPGQDLDLIISWASTFSRSTRAFLKTLAAELQKKT